ncbi:McrC family protein [Alienimonas sp. DA493]|uniref:McrC family protein n=1 Tax=Alienimonas sp. DA493 TaxID=3373605 RepID=UPI003754765F
MSDPASLTLSEWETASPETHDVLRGQFLDGDARRVADELDRSRRLRFTELQTGTRTAAGSHVGRVRVGGLTVTVKPKLDAGPLLRLLRYAHGLRRLKLLSEAEHLVEQCGFEDLLVLQLNAEARELIARGLRREAVGRTEPLASPRGRIAVDRLARAGGTATASLPCRHFPRTEDTPLNRALLAGLRLAGEVTGLIELKRDARRLAGLLDERVARVRPDLPAVERAEARLNRLTAAYGPALTLTRLLVEGRGVALEGRSASALPGYLFDMNAFFQALLSRFLRENLPAGCSLRDERGLTGMLRYAPGCNPRGRRPPTPRPDYAVLRPGEPPALPDAKYRDLWEKRLPREMLYQLVVYAVSRPARPRAAIPYPTADPAVREARIDVADPLAGRPLGRVDLRPVNLTQIERLVGSPTAAARRERAALARRLAFGDVR